MVKILESKKKYLNLFHLVDGEYTQQTHPHLLQHNIQYIILSSWKSCNKQTKKANTNTQNKTKVGPY